ncbi:endolytic transglycosylase MltG [Carboxylicivirga linearis]|uniref:Endolytic murein transglycosylase n=1 Tax=Carboxylicivirga linearis TaxID=1628157 RepID=A0ABS5JUM5_9BACT|nr:endolytic transglycosylase MltG [Carboxylicivirga linearis]MBS2098601.1 endolytic transglycosylase MltG [Carboxylicivirga linearis]
MSIKQRNKRKKTSRLLVGLTIIIALFVATGLMGLKYYKWIFAENINLTQNQQEFIYIPTHSSFEDLIQILDENKLLKNSISFKWVAELKKYEAVKPGRYQIEEGMSNNTLINLLRSGKQSPVKVTFNNIRTKEELAGVISHYIEADSISLLESLNDNILQKEIGVNSETILTLFLPNTYEFWWNTTAEKFIKRMNTEHQKFWNEDRTAKAKELNLTPTEVSILAAIVDEETIKADEKPKVAGLYLNRLKKNIRLQADPTIKYAMGDFSVQRILKKDLEINSPYNTYKYAGLPPGPIRIPSISGINAVLNRTQHNYLYMCAKEDFSGYHNFAKTLKQHNQNAAKFQRALNKRKIYR